MSRQRVTEDGNDRLIASQYDLVEFLLLHEPVKSINSFLTVMEVKVIYVSLIARLGPSSGRSPIGLCSGEFFLGE